MLGAWAALVPFIGPYFDFAYTPSANQAWMWMAERGYMEVAPGAAAFVGGLILLFSTSRVMAICGAWLGVAGGAWLILGPPLAAYLNVPTSDNPTLLRSRVAPGIAVLLLRDGAAILFVASFGCGRISTHSVRDVRAAERRAAAFTAREERVEPAPTTAPDTSSWAEPTTYELERGRDTGAYEHGRLAEPTEPAFAPGQDATERRAETESRVARHDNEIPEPSER